MTLDSYTNLFAAEIAKTVIVKTIEEKVRGLGEAAATKKRKMMLGNADPNSNPKKPKCEATLPNEAKKAKQSRIDAVIEGVIVQSMGQMNEAMIIQQNLLQLLPLPPQQSKKVAADPDDTPDIEFLKPTSVEGQRRVTAYTLWSKRRKERMIQEGDAQSLTSPIPERLRAEWKALPKAEKEVLQKEAKRVIEIS